MSFLPVVERELRVASRRRSTYATRAAAGLAASMAFFWIWLGELLQSIPNTGGRVFGFLSLAALGFCLLAGVLFSADCLSEEKREGTLGLLFLAELQGYDVVLGKLMATSLSAFYGLLAILPILALPLVLGGITFGEFWRMVAALTNTLFFSVSLAMLISALCRRASTAQAVSLILLLLVAANPASWIYLRAFPSLVMPEWIRTLSPIGSYRFAFDAPATSSHAMFWASIGIFHTLAWISLGLASLILPHTWQEKPAGAAEQADRRRCNHQTPRRAPTSMSDPVALERRPYYWLAIRGRIPPAFLWLILGVSALLALVALLAIPGGAARGVAGWAVMFGLHGILKIWTAAEASRRFAIDRRTGALELLLGTPVSEAEILGDQRRALWRQLAGPLAAVVGVDALVALGLAEARAGGSIIFIGVSLAMLLVDLYTLTWAGMWVGVSARRMSRAVFGAVWRVLALPWLIFAGLLLMTGTNWSRGPQSSGLELVLVWFAIGVINDLFVWVSAHRGLREDFRELVVSFAKP